MGSRQLAKCGWDNGRGILIRKPNVGPSKGSSPPPAVDTLGTEGLSRSWTSQPDSGLR